MPTSDVTSVLREGDLLATVDTQDALSPLDSELRDELLRSVAGRMTG